MNSASMVVLGTTTLPKPQSYGLHISKTLGMLARGPTLNQVMIVYTTFRAVDPKVRGLQGLLITHSASSG